MLDVRLTERYLDCSEFGYARGGFAATGVVSQREQAAGLGRWPEFRPLNNKFGGCLELIGKMLKTIQARWQLGYLSPEQIPEVAADLLSQGIDSPSLRQLAGLTQPVREETAPLMQRLIRELQMEPIPRTEALRLVIVDVAERVATGTIEPYIGAAELHGLWSDAGGSEYQAVFAVALDDYDQVPEVRTEIVEDIRAAARGLLHDLRSSAAEQGAAGDVRPGIAPE